MIVNGIEIDIANLEKPLLLVSEEEELLFQRLLQPTIEHQLIQCQLALSTRKSISLVKDIWLAMYRDRENLYINSGHAMLYPIRLILFELVTQAKYFQRLAKKSRGDECLSFMYAVILLQFVLQWLKERFRDNQEVLVLKQESKKWLRLWQLKLFALKYGNIHKNLQVYCPNRIN